MDANYNTAYVYGQDGERTNKYTSQSETLYFNKMWTLHTDSGNAIYGGQSAKNIYLGETRIVTKLNSGENPTYSEEYNKQYFYHSDHLGSASLISDSNGDEYQRIEYTPYGETWVEKTQNTGLEFLPYKFTAKEQDEETGLYYYGARYLDSRYSRWISTDPALGDYVPQAPISDEAKKHNQNLPGMGGVFNHINGNLYHYAGNNPVRYIDPDGKIQIQVQAKYTMQSGKWGNIHGTKTSILNEGCAIVISANFSNSIGNKIGYTPSQINNKFVLSDGRMNFEALGADLGYSVEKIDGKLTTDTLIIQNNDKNKQYLTVVNVNYDSGKHDHWVGVKGIELKNGKAYIRISPSSENDSSVSEGSLRNGQGWLTSSDGTILVPVEQTKGYINFKKDINNEN